VIVAAGLSIIVLILLRRGAARAASATVIATWFVLVAYDTVTGGATLAASMNAYLFVILSAGVLIGGAAALIVTGLSIAAAFGAAMLETFGTLPTRSTLGIFCAGVHVGRTLPCAFEPEPQVRFDTDEDGTAGTS
jgi:hypothetical protein